MKNVATYSSDRYKILRLLGSGGMGEVFLATDRNLDSKVVIKIPHASMLRDAEFAVRFQREIRSLVKLRHRSIVSIMDFGEQDGVPFAVMQYLEGGSLEDRLANGPQDEAALHAWLPDVSAALDFIHREGYVHRDIKPANILFDREGNAYVSDFGVAKVVDRSDSKQMASATMTGTGMVMGTPDYMAPELVMGEEFDHRVDQYALAITVFEFLCGRRPFEGPTPAAVMVKQSTMPAPTLKTACRTATPGAVTAVDRALSKLPSTRYDSCGQFGAAVLGASPKNTPSTGSVVTSTQAATGRNSALSCPSCGAVLRLGSQHAAKTIRCSGCQATLKVAKDLARLTVAGDTSDASAPPNSTRASSAKIRIIKPSAVSSVGGRNAPTSIPHSRRLILPIAIGLMLVLLITVSVHFGGNGEAGFLAAVQSSPEAANPVPKESVPALPTSAGIVLSPIPTKTIREEEMYFFTAKVIGHVTGTEQFRLASDHPDGMTIHSDNGEVAWKPTEAQGPNNFEFTVHVLDMRGTILDSQQFSIRVEEVNIPPIFGPVPEVTVKPGEQFQFAVTAYDPDIPKDTVTFGLLGGERNGFDIDKSTGEIIGRAPVESVETEIPINLVVADSTGASNGLLVKIKVDIGGSLTSPEPPTTKAPDTPPEFFSRNPDFMGERVLGNRVDMYTLHIGKYLGAGKSDVKLIHQSSGTLSGNKKQLSSAYSIGAEYQASLTYKVVKDGAEVPRESVRIDVGEVVKNTSTHKVSSGFVLQGDLQDATLTMPTFTWTAYDKATAMRPARQMLQVGRELQWAEQADKIYFGRFVVNRISGSEFDGAFIYDGTTVGTSTNRDPAYATYSIGGRFNEDGTVGIRWGKVLATKLASANVQVGRTNVFKFQNGILVGVDFQISQ